MKTLTLSTKNQIVVPKQVRSVMKLTGGDQLVVDRVSETEVVFKKAPSFYDLLGTATPGASDPVKRIRQLRDEWR